MNTAIVEVKDLHRSFRHVEALDGVNLTLAEGKIYGLLGRNGAGKTTLMSILTAQAFASSGSVSVFGEPPYENEKVLRRLCFIRESQKYADDFKPVHAFRAASLFHRNWDQALAMELARDFGLPLNRRIKKLSRGQLSAVGAIIGLASRAELTFFDEPYLGLDAVARQLFYDRLLADYAEFPRTIVLSSHLIDEVANILEHVVIIDRGKIILDQDADTIRGSAFTLAGSRARVEAFAAGRKVLHREDMGALAAWTIDGPLSPGERREAQELDLEISPVSLQQFVIRKTLDAGGAAIKAAGNGGADARQAHRTGAVQ